ncbi:MAG: YhbY family RNA-binding protein [Clostridia bacterium]|nr:YhbY family RNA-binding protein [Clostridia bacterium]
MLTSKQRAYLRGLANSLQPISQVGKSGITDEVCRTADLALEARELIKMSVLETAGVTAREAADQLAELCKADTVQVIGTKFVLYKRDNTDPRIVLVTNKKR